MGSSKKTKALKLARQAQGMLTKVIELIERDEHLLGIIQQTDSVCGFMASTKRELLKEHLDVCLQKPATEQRGRVIKELLKIYNLPGQ